MKTDSILFDLDGTLWDSREGVQKSWGSVIARQKEHLKIPTVEDIGGIMGLTADGVMQKLFPQLSAARGAELFKSCSEEEIVYLTKHGATLYPGLIDTLKMLSALYPLFIVSNCAKGYIESFLTAHDTNQYFTDWECADTTGLGKSDNIHLIVERNHLRQPVYVGDTKWDYDAATAAGIPFIHAAYGFGGAMPKEIPAINSPAALLPLLASDQV